MTFPSAWDVPEREPKLEFDCDNLYGGDVLDMISDPESDVWTRTQVGWVTITFMSKGVI